MSSPRPSATASYSNSTATRNGWTFATATSAWLATKACGSSSQPTRIAPTISASCVTACSRRAAAGWRSPASSIPTRAPSFWNRFARCQIKWERRAGATKFGRTINTVSLPARGCARPPMPARHIRVLQLSTIQLIIHNSDWFALRRKMSNHTEPPEGIIFDMDGVLVDSNPFHLEKWVALLTEHGVEFDPAQLPEQILGQRNDTALRFFFGDKLSEADRRRLIEALEEKFRRAFRPHARPLPAVEPLIAECLRA